jgi:uncharacterized protein (TIGR02118 family)
VSDRLVFALRRRPGLSRDEFQRYWREQHAPLVVSVAADLAIARYQQVHTTLDDPTYGGAPFDGVAELWFGGAPTAGAAAAAARLLADEREFIDLAASPILVAREHVLVDGPSEGTRMTTLLYRKAGTSLDAFRGHWRDVHGPLAVTHAPALGAQRYVQLQALDGMDSFPPAIERGAPAPPDGVGEAFFVAGDIDVSQAEPAMQTLAADAEHFVDPARTVSAFGTVHVVIG